MMFSKLNNQGTNKSANADNNGDPAALREKKTMLIRPAAGQRQQKSALLPQGDEQSAEEETAEGSHDSEAADEANADGESADDVQSTDDEIVQSPRPNATTATSTSKWSVSSSTGSSLSREQLVSVANSTPISTAQSTPLLLDPSKPIGYSNGDDPLPEESQKIIWLLNEEYGACAFYPSLVEQLLKETPTNPLIGKPTSGNDFDLWNKENELFTTASDRVLLFTIYSQRYAVNVVPSNRTLLRQSYLYISKFMFHYGYKKWSSGRKECFLVACFMASDNFDEYLQSLVVASSGLEVGSYATATSLQSQDDFWETARLPDRMMVNEFLLRKWRQVFQKDVYLQDAFSERERLLDVVKMWHVLRHPLPNDIAITLAPPDYRDIPDTDAGWSTFYALVCKKVVGFGEAQAADVLWKNGYPGAANCIVLFKDLFLAPLGIKLEDFTQTDLTPMHKALLLLAYRFIWNHLGHYLSHDVIRMLVRDLTKLNRNFIHDFSYLPKLFDEINDWAQDPTHRFSDKNIVYYGVHFLDIEEWCLEGQQLSAKRMLKLKMQKY